MTTSDWARRVIHTTAIEYELPLRIIFMKSQTRKIAYPRMVASHLLRETLGLNDAEIAEYWGLDRSTIYHHWSTVQATIDTDPEEARRIDTLKTYIEFQIHLFNQQREELHHERTFERGPRRGLNGRSRPSYGVAAESREGGGMDRGGGRYRP